jgi:aminopeptidase N
MELPHAPYLFMLAVGDFAIHKDNWHGKEVSYYVEPKFAPFAKEVFGHTPEAIDFFSKTLGVDYPWYKYAQVVVHDFVSGAMENTTASVFGEDIFGYSRNLTDQANRTGVVHELFHQWFGNYTTMESWSNLTLNESFADFGEIMWLEYKYGKDVADEHVYRGIKGYLENPDARTKSLVRFNYQDKNEVFDGVTYQKGGRILNMLRNYLGKEAFYKGLNLYLKKNAFKNTEAHHLRLALEEASGLDLNWFFNQWYFGAGHPELRITYKWNEASKTQAIYLQQIQNGPVFILPVAVDFYLADKTQRTIVWMRTRADTFTIQLDSKPNLVNVDAEKTLIAEKMDDKSMAEYAFQYEHAPLYLDRYEAIEASVTKQADENSQKILLAALKDSFDGLQLKVINSLDLSNNQIRNSAIPILRSLAQEGESSLVRAEAILTLGKLKSPEYLGLFNGALNSNSDVVKGAGLKAIALLNPAEALALAKKYDRESKGKFKDAIDLVYVTCGGDEQWPFVYKLYGFPDSPGKFPLDLMAEFIARVENPEYAQQGINALKSLVFVHNRQHMAQIIIEKLNSIKTNRTKMHDNASAEAAQSAILAITGK